MTQMLSKLRVIFREGRRLANYAGLLAGFALLIFWCPTLRAENSGGRGGVFAEVHLNSLASFDSSISGLPIVVGGEGFGYLSKNFRLGGGGGGGFLWSSSTDTHFGMGYGGIIGEYIFTNWLSLSLLIGGGGYALSKIVSKTDTTTIENQVSAGGFLLVKPSLSVEFPISPSVRLAASLGLFLPNVGNLQSVTSGLRLIFGRM